jgi:hypothetical protein
LRACFRERRDLFRSHELARLPFMRWLLRTGRLLPWTGAAGSRSTTFRRHPDANGSLFADRGAGQGLQRRSTRTCDDSRVIEGGLRICLTAALTR